MRETRGNGATASGNGERGGVTRRGAIVAGLSLVAAGAGVAGIVAGAGNGSAEAATEPGAGKPRERGGSRPPRMPVAFFPHGGGPWPFVDLGMGARSELDALTKYLVSLRSLPPTRPKALVVVSAHWEEREPTVMTSEHPPMLYDYYGFPPESYAITWPAPGDRGVAARVRELLAKGGFASGENPARGFDHGTFVPLKLAYPAADVPTVQLSLKQGLDPEEHLAIGRALAPLRDEGVFILGSGMTFHNLRAFGSAQSRPVSEEFDRWLRGAATDEPAARDRKLAQWAQAPSARAAHPREEHLLPLMVIAGAAGGDRGAVAYEGTLMGLRLSAYHYG